MFRPGSRQNLNNRSGELVFERLNFGDHFRCAFVEEMSTGGRPGSAPGSTKFRLPIGPTQILLTRCFCLR